MAAHAQLPACIGGALFGTVHDPSGAIVSGAQVILDGNTPLSTDNSGHYRFACVANGRHQLHVTADGFADAILDEALPRPDTLDTTLQLQAVQTSVNVTEEAETLPFDAASSSPAAYTLASKDLQTLADDPDNLARELQQLAAAAGGNPAGTLITVGGFQNESALPPKSSIAYIKVNPDLFSSRVSRAAVEGGRVEVHTKPGQPTFHGALFTTNGAPGGPSLY